MVLTNKTYIAIGGLVLIAGSKGPLPLQEIAKVFHISVSYLEQIFNRLKNAGIVNGVRGPSGGYTLARPASEIQLLTVINLLSAQAFTRAYEGVDQTKGVHLLEKMQMQFSQALNRLTLADMLLADEGDAATPPPSGSTSLGSGVFGEQRG